MAQSQGSPLANRPSVALLVETSNAYARGLLHGIRAYLREHRSWTIYIGEQSRGESAPGWLKTWKGDGIIARIENMEIAKAVLALGLPTVDVSAARHVPNLVYVETDDAEIARLAATHLLERNFRHFGFCGDPRFNWSNWREQHFLAQIASAHFECQVYRPSPDTRPSEGREKDRSDLAAWVEKLPRPAAIMAAYDIRGREILDVCRALEITVPDEIAVIGVDNDDLLCDLSDPPLTSIVPDTLKTGYEAARILDKLMAGEKERQTAHLIKPLGIVTRKSTDVLATEDSDLSAAVRYIRARACDGIGVEDVVRAVCLSRRTLESRFQKVFGRTVHEEITRVQIERVKELLSETDLSLVAVAHRAGYRHPEYMSVAFKRETGVSPSVYRNGHGGRG